MKTINGGTYVLVQPAGEGGCAACVAHRVGWLCTALQSVDCLLSGAVWAVEVDAEREAFETACVAKFVQWRDAGNTAEDNGAPATRESLCWRHDNGEYGVRALNTAWWGWQQGRAWHG